MRVRFLFAFLLALGFVAPRSARGQDVMNIHWDDCRLAGTALKQFACDTNSGSDRIVVSVRSSSGVPQANGAEIYLSLVTSGSDLSPWFHMESGGCRAGSLTAFLDFTSGPSSCFDLWQGAALGGAQWTSGYVSGGRAQLHGVCGIPGTTPLPANTEAYAFAFVIDHQKSVGVAVCDGCSGAACIMVAGGRVTQPAGLGDFLFTGGSFEPSDRYVVGWKCPADVYTDDPLPCENNCSTPTRRPSWGSIKGLYR